ncbi:MAG: ribosome small subunit-dependent GTPase A [Crocinitomicaceae bacterium]|nr:ribosome small subunit-dependent GTPase A [Crocinitomicaceae bacterium]
MKGIVYRSTGSWYTVKSDQGKFFEARIKGKFRNKDIKTTNPIAVGDLVSFSIKEDGKGWIEEIHPRKNYMIRKSVNLSKEAHIIGSNIDLCVLVVTVSNPVTSTGFIDRFTVTAGAYDIPILLVFNKLDIYGLEDKQLLEEYIAVYEKAGYDCLVTSAAKNIAVDKLKNKLESKTVLFSGHSGAGKSSLINAMNPSLDLPTGELSEAHLKGKHTTTFAEMFDLSSTIRLIDTPGIKGFGLIDLEKHELAQFFPEMFALSSNCKFNNCVHINEPGCAVLEALNNGEIADFRYQSYFSMYNDDTQETYRALNY